MNTKLTKEELRVRAYDRLRAAQLACGRACLSIATYGDVTLAKASAKDATRHIGQALKSLTKAGR